MPAFDPSPTIRQFLRHRPVARTVSNPCPRALTGLLLEVFAERMMVFEARALGCGEQLVHGFTNVSSAGFHALGRSEARPGGFLRAADRLLDSFQALGHRRGIGGR